MMLQQWAESQKVFSSSASVRLGIFVLEIPEKNVCLEGACLYWALLIFEPSSTALSPLWKASGTLLF